MHNLVQPIFAAKMNIPQIKKTVNSFLLGEEGRIKKESILKLGLLVAATAVGIGLNSESASAKSNTIPDFYPTCPAGTGDSTPNSELTCHANASGCWWFHGHAECWTNPKYCHDNEITLKQFRVQEKIVGTHNHSQAGGQKARVHANC